MHLLPRPARLFAWFLPLLLVATQPLPAQQAKPAAAPAAGATRTPWLYQGSDIPQDKEWIFGKLSNGVRYAVRRNGVPPGQVSIRIRMDVGALHEQQSERGYAHLLEHLVFRQSRHLADGQAIATWQRLGATFGSDTNAQTSWVATTYKLDLPDAGPGKLNESFKLLAGMMIAPTLSETNVRTDVPIVMAEKRERGGTGARVFDQTQETLFAGQRLSVRPIIGTDATLQAATGASVQAFHKRWYRPENAVIIAAGDVDPAMLEGLIANHFSMWPVTGKTTPAPPFGDPLAPKGAAGPNPVGETRVLVEPDMPRAITYAILRPWRPVRDTVIYNEGKLTDAVAQRIVYRRLETRARAGGSYLAAEVSQDKFMRSADVTFVAITPLGPDWKTALDEVRGVIADAVARPPSQAEIDREAAELGVAYDSAVEQRRLMTGSNLADEVVGALDIRETVASPEVVRDVFASTRAKLTPAKLLAHTRRIFTGTVTRAVYVTPAAGEASAAQLRTALAAPIAADPRARPDQRALSFAELPPIGTPAAPAAVKPSGLLEIEQVDFANGVKVLIWPTQDDPGRVTVKVRFGAGWRAFDAQNALYARLGDIALVGSGAGPLGQEEIDRIMTGRKMGFDFGIDDNTFTFAADTRDADLADQLYLFAAKFAAPRWDANPVLRAKAAAKLGYDGFATSPQGVLERDLKFLERGRDAVYRTPTPAEMEAATPEGFRAAWEPVLRQGPIEVQLFGDFNREAALAALGKTFGALPPRGALPAGTAPARTATLPASPAPVVLYHRGDAIQAAGIVAWPTGGGMAGIGESRQLEILSQLFSNRLLDAMREKLGQAYSPQVANDWPTDMDGGGRIFAIAQLDPKAVPVFFATADEIAADLAAKPPSADELARVTEPLRQQLTRATTSSAFFMYLLEGASEDPRKVRAVRTLLTDYTMTTPAAMQALAQKYLQRGKSWRVAVIPQGQVLANGAAGSGEGMAGR
jgi:zinc protease